MTAGPGRPPGPGEVLGRLVHVQVQRARLKPGPRGARAYDPSPITVVDALQVDPRGATGVLAGREVPDVHHPDHPDTRSRGSRTGLSLMTTGGYARLRARYGPHLADGVAGESLLVDAPAPLDASFEGAALVVETVGGLVPLTGLAVASPCVEFTRFCLGLPADAGVDDEVRATLDALDGGARGLLAAAAAPGTLRAGDLVRVAAPAPAGSGPR